MEVKCAHDTQDVDAGAVEDELMPAAPISRPVVDLTTPVTPRFRGLTMGDHRFHQGLEGGGEGMNFPGRGGGGEGIKHTPAGIYTPEGLCATHVAIHTMMALYYTRQVGAVPYRDIETSGGSAAWRCLNCSSAAASSRVCSEASTLLFS